MFFAFWGGEYFFCLHATYGDVMVRFLKKKTLLTIVGRLIHLNLFPLQNSLVIFLFAFLTFGGLNGDSSFIFFVLFPWYNY